MKSPRALLLLLSLVFAWSHAASASQSWIFDERGTESRESLRRLDLVAKGLKVLWWNIGRCSTQSRALRKNIEVLMSRRIKPDFIALGEYDPVRCDSSLRELLNEHYPHQDYQAYNSGFTELGIKVFSKYPLSVTESTPLYWTPRTANEHDRQAFRRSWMSRTTEGRTFTRQYKSFYVNVGQGFSIVPFHFLEPWVAMRELEGPLETGLEMVFLENTPLAHQVDRFVHLLRREFNEHDRVITIGDSNVPNTVGIQTTMYESLRGQMHEIFEGNENESSMFTFPTASTSMRNHFPFNVWTPKIDHCFVSNSLYPSVRGQEVVYLKGSDHYPLFMTFNAW